MTEAKERTDIVDWLIKLYKEFGSKIIGAIAAAMIAAVMGFGGKLYDKYFESKEPAKPLAEKVATPANTQEAETTPSKKSTVTKVSKTQNTQPATKKAPVQPQVADIVAAKPAPAAKPKPQQQAVVVQPAPTPVVAPVVEPQPIQQQSSSNSSSIGDM